MLKSIMRSPVAIALLFLIAAGLLGFGTVGAVQAAPRIQSNDYRAEVELTDIETALTENGVIVEGDDTLLLQSFADANADKGLSWSGAVKGFAVGVEYDDVLAVRNVGTIDEYVRVSVYLYWEDADGNKLRDLDPGLIHLSFVEGNGWTIDPAASTEERTVLYYRNPNSDDGSIAPGEDTTPFADKLMIDSKVLTEATRDAEGNDSMDYKGARFRVKAVVDAVQTHSATEAMTGAWGRTV